LLVLAFWRIPLWLSALVLCVWNLSEGSYPDDLHFVFQFSTACVIMLLCLDSYWMRKCIPAWHEPPAA